MEEEPFFPQWETLKLTEAEQAIVILEDDLIDDVEKKLQNALVCKILTSNMVNEEVFRSTMPILWNFQENLRIENVGWNIYLCIFKTLNDKQRVLENGPWFYDMALLVFEQPPRGNCKFTDLDFQYASFWIHFHHLPIACFSRKMATAFGNLVGDFETVETDDEGICWGRTMRVRIRIDVKKPLRRGVKLKLGSMGEETWIPITYEKLPDFCYGCGKLGHVLEDCDSLTGTALEDFQYREEDLRYGEEDLQYGGWEGNETFKGRETKEEGWEEEDCNSNDNQNFRSSESALDDRRGSPKTISDGDERRKMAEEESAKNGKEKIGEETVGVISRENKEGDEKMKESTRKAEVNEITKVENGDVAHLQVADQQIKKKDKGKMIWAEQQGWKESPEMGSDQMEATRMSWGVSMGQLRREWRSRGPSKEWNA